MKKRIFMLLALVAILGGSCQKDEVEDLTAAESSNAHLNLKSVIPESEPNDVYYQADLIPYSGDVAVGELDGSDIDWWYYDIYSDGINVTISFDGTATYITLYIYNSLMQKIAQIEEGETYSMSNNTGRYYIKASGYPGIQYTIQYYDNQ